MSDSEESSIYSDNHEGFVADSSEDEGELLYRGEPVRGPLTLDQLPTMSAVWRRMRGRNDEGSPVEVEGLMLIDADGDVTEAWTLDGSGIDTTTIVPGVGRVGIVSYSDAEDNRVKRTAVIRWPAERGEETRRKILHSNARYVRCKKETQAEIRKSDSRKSFKGLIHNEPSDSVQPRTSAITKNRRRTKREQLLPTPQRVHIESLEPSMISSPGNTSVARGSSNWPLGSATFTLFKEQPERLAPLLRESDPRELYSDLRKLAQQFRSEQIDLRAQGKCPVDVRISKPRNASRLHVTGALQFVYFKLLTAPKNATVRYLSKKSTAAEVTKFAAWLISRNDRNLKKISRGSALRYLDTVLQDIRIYDGVDLRNDVRLQEFMDDLDRNALPAKPQKKALTFATLLEMLQVLTDKTSRERILGPFTNNTRLLAQVWGIASLLQFLGISRFGEIGAGAATRLETNRLLSWGVSLRLFKLKEEANGFTNEQISKRLDTTIDVPVEHFLTTDVDGFDIVLKAGVRSKGRRTRARRNVEKSLSIWDARDGNLPKITDMLRKLYNITKSFGAKEGTPVCAFEKKSGKFEAMDNGEYNTIMKELGRTIGMKDWKMLSSIQWRKGGKSTATRRERLHVVNIAQGRSTALGGWSTQIGNSPIYDQQPREFYVGMSERMIKEGVESLARGSAVRDWEETFAMSLRTGDSTSNFNCNVM